MAKKKRTTKSTPIRIPEGYRRLAGSDRRPASGAELLGRANANEMLSVSIRLRRRPGPHPYPTRSTANTPGSERRYLTQAQFAGTYGASLSDLELVVQFAQTNGLAVVEISAARRTVAVKGSVKVMEQAFRVKLNRYKCPRETYRGREGHIHLPSNLSRVVTGVFGLDNRRMARRASVPAGANPLTPPQVAQLYGFPTPADATGQTIGLIEFGGGFNVDPATGRPPDVDAFFQGLGLPAPIVVAGPPVDGTTNNPGIPPGDDAEVLLDIDVAGSVAPGANIVVYFAPWTEQGWVDVLTTAMNDANQPSVLSISWGWPEEETALGLTWSAMAMQDVSSSFQEAAALGITVFAASGDDGTNCQIGDGAAHVLYPTSDPWVTSCGGTIITDVVGEVFNEATWNDEVDKLGLPIGGATGGGISSYFPLPDWQKGVGVPHPHRKRSVRPMRGVPDIAGNASGYSGYTLTVDGVAETVGGTSAVAPLYAGLIALMNRRLQAFRLPNTGYLNPTLYALRNLGVFRDIADGKSNSVGFGGFLGSSGISPGYKSVAGWDACTGLGVIRGAHLLYELLPKIPREWLIDPWALILGPIYVKLHLPDPPPIEDLAAVYEFTKLVASRLDAREKTIMSERTGALRQCLTTMLRAMQEA